MKGERRRRRSGGFLSRLLPGRSSAHGEAPAAEPEAPSQREHTGPRETHRKRGGHGSRRKRLLIGGSVIAGLGLLTAIGVHALRGRLGGESIWGLHDQAATLFAAGDFEAAAALDRRILALRPEDHNARFNLGAALLKLNRPDEAWPEIERVARDDPRHTAAQMALALRALDEGHEDDAVVRLRGVIAAGDPPFEAHARLGDLLRARGDAAGALTSYEALSEDTDCPLDLRIGAAVRAARLRGLRAPFHPDEQAERNRERAGYQRARELAQRQLAGDDEQVRRAKSHLARIELALGRPNEALAACNDAVDRTRKLVDAAQDGAERVANAGALCSLQTLRAEIYGALGEDDLAREELTAALGATEAPPPDAFETAADYHAARREFDAAARLLRRGVELHPRDLELGLALVRWLFAAGDADGAEREAVRLSEALPTSTRVLLRLGEVRALRGDMAGARAAYERARELAPDDPLVQVRLADAAFAEAGQHADVAEERLDQAKSLADAVLARDPGNVGALVVAAKVLLMRAGPRDQKRLDAAAKLLRTAVDRDPFTLDAHTFLAWADFQRGRPSEAVLGLERVIANLPEERPALRLLLARALLAAGDTERAVTAARRGLLGAPDDPGGLRTLVDALRSSNRIDEALDALDRLQRAEPDVIVHVLLQAQLQAERGNIAGAEERFARAEEMAAAIPDEQRSMEEQVRVTQARAAFYQGVGDTASANDAFTSLLGRTRANATGHVRYGEFLLALGQEAEAEREFQQAIATEPDAVLPRRALADLYFGRRVATPELIALVETVARAHPGEPIVDYLRGKLAFLQGDLLVAADLLTRFLEVRPDDADAHFAVGIVLTRAGRFEEAVRHMERAAELLPRSAEARVSLARTRYAWAEDLMRRGRNREAQAALRRASQEDPDAAEPHSLLARALVLGGDVDLSEREIRLLLARDPDDPVARRMLASVYALRHEYDRAASELDRLLQSVPADWPSWTMLATVQLERGKPVEALAAARRARAAAPDEPLSMAAVVQVLLDTGELALARTEVDEQIAASPRAAYPRYLAALVAQRQGRHADVVQRCDEALDLEPAFAAALRLATGVLAGPLRDEKGAYAETIARAERAPESLEMQHLRASFAWRAGDTDDALARLSALVERDPPYLPAVTLLASVRAERGEATAGRDVLSRAIAVFPEVADLHFLMGESFLRQAVARAGPGEVPEPERGLALRSFEEADRLRPGHPPTLNNLAWLLMQSESTLQKALERVHAAVTIAPEYVPYLDTEGMVLIELGRPQAAVELYRHALGLLERQETELARDEREAVIDARHLAARRARLERTKVDVGAHYDRALAESEKK